MTNETQDNRIHFLYRITNLINGKIYIGQSVDTVSRWRAHRRDAAQDHPNSLISRAIKKYGNNSFEFEVIATCKTWDDANDIETLLVSQYNSRIPNGYNISFGGINAPKSEEWIQKMKDWHANLTPEEKEKRSKMHSESIINHIVTKGHPCAGRIWSEEERLKQEETRKTLDYNKIYTEEIRQNMSEAHIGIKDSEETKTRKAESAKEAWEKRIDYSRKCEAPGCDVSGKAKYKIINNIRYCNKHGLRMLRYSRLDTLNS